MSLAPAEIRQGLSFNNPGLDPQATRQRFLDTLQALVHDKGDRLLLEAAAGAWAKAERVSARSSEQGEA